MMKNYVDAAEKYRSQIDNLHLKLGVDSPITPASLNAVKNSYGEMTEGAELANEIYGPGLTKGIAKVAGGLGGAIGGHLLGFTGAEAAGGTVGLYMASKIAPMLEKVLGRPIKATLIPGLLKVIGEGNFSSIGEALEHSENIVKGNAAIQTGVNDLFTGGNLAGKKLFDYSYDDKSKEKIRKFVEEGGLNQQIQNSLQKTATPQPTPTPTPHFAEGGVVEKQVIPKPANVNQDKDHLSTAYPEQAMLMAAAKGRVYNYLNGAKPKKNQPKLVFDKEHEDPEHKRSYERALNIADKPLSILREIQKGTISPEHVKHLTEMWPEVHGQLSKKITEKLTERQAKGEKAPPFHIRQGLSMLMGTALDSTMTPANIQAAQGVFATQKANQNQGPKKNTSKLGEIGKAHQTMTQAAESRQTTGRS